MFVFLKLTIQKFHNSVKIVTFECREKIVHDVSKDVTKCQTNAKTICNERIKLHTVTPVHDAPFFIIQCGWNARNLCNVCSGMLITSV